jgi:adenosylcobinamide kinase/adenosylcobinamide-phosphate guanylyltransferase
LHFVTGGAFNGKRAWVKKMYMVHDADRWVSAYEHSPLPEDVKDMDQDLLVLEGIEMWVKNVLQTYDPNRCQETFKNCLENWLTWEEVKQNRKLVVIGTDINKGIVPLEKENRFWRDITGWVYQDLAAKADRVDVIWYGMNQTIKGGDIIK